MVATPIKVPSGIGALGIRNPLSRRGAYTAFRTLCTAHCVTEFESRRSDHYSRETKKPALANQRRASALQAVDSRR